MPMELSDILNGAGKFGASDIHLMEGEPPYLRVDGRLHVVQAPKTDHDTLLFYLKSMMPAILEPTLEERRGIDFAYDCGNKVRYRVNAYYERTKLKIVMRAIPIEPK